MFQILPQPFQRPRTTPEQLREMEERNPQGFVLRTGEGEFKFTGERQQEGRIIPAFQRAPERQFIPTPSIVSTERIRNRFQRNIDRIRQFENRLSTPAFIPPKQSKEGFI